ncbi:hypothetical protein NHX12_012218, partial [Muraenolepis orangiensis]
ATMEDIASFEERLGSLKQKGEGLLKEKVLQRQQGSYILTVEEGRQLLSCKPAFCSFLFHTLFCSGPDEQKPHAQAEVQGIAMPVHNQQVSLHALQPLPQDHQLVLGPLGPLLHTLLEL